MIKRIIDLSEPSYVHMAKGQLLIEKEGETVARIPIEDLGVFVLQHPGIVISQAVIIACQKNKVVLLFCDERHLPYSVILPMVDGHSLHSKVLRRQIQMGKTTQKRLWQQIIRHKIKQQAKTLDLLGKNSKPVQSLVKQVKTADSGNHEAQAAQKYWKLLMGDDFRRNPDANDINTLLNYGYAILRAMIARALVSSGLHPALGLKHTNQYNGLCLADDLMEPLRPWVDYLACQIAGGNKEMVIDINAKQHFLGLLSEAVSFEGKAMSLMVASHYLAAKYKLSCEDSTVELDYPQLKSRMAV